MLEGIPWATIGGLEVPSVLTCFLSSTVFSTVAIASLKTSESEICQIYNETCK
jgi:hypothetical protein